MKLNLKKVVLAMILPAFLAACGNTAKPEETTETAAESEFNAITGRKFTQNVTVGINLGNTLDASGGTGLNTETSWGNPAITKELIQSISDIGIDVVRLPVTWDRHIGIYPDYLIDEEWFLRVEEVVNMCLDEGLYVILNTQHEDRLLLPSIAKENYETAKNYITAVWRQISARFADYPSRLVFNVMNEPRSLGMPNEWSGGTAEARSIVNKLNADCLAVIRDGGGHNADRVVMLPTYAASVWYSDDFVLPPNDDKLVVSVHAYEPYDFALNREGTDKFDADKNNLDDLFGKIEKNFLSKDIPVIMDETGAMNKNGNLDQRVDWAASYAAKAASAGVPCLLWDNGIDDIAKGESFGLINRQTAEWTYPEIVETFLKAYQ